jgi:SM-20-related protein
MASKRKVTPDQEVNNASPLTSEDNTLANHSSIDISSIRTSISMTPNYIPQNLIISLRNDAINLHKKGLFSSGGTGGRSGKQINNQNSRQCDIAGLFDDDVMDVESEAREDIFDVMGELKEYLSVGLGVELDDSMELQYLRYDEKGGFYKRHIDHDNINSVEFRREVSLVLYLTDETETPWDPKKDGGFLRCYPRKSGTSSQIIDVAPSSGTLVLFNSRELEHEVLPTYRTRWALVGWFMAKPNENKKNKKRRKKRLLSLAR